MQQQQLSYQIVRLAERAKIALSEAQTTESSLEFIEAKLNVEVRRDCFENAIEPSLTKIEALMHQALTQAAKSLAGNGLAPEELAVEAGTYECQPDVIYVTGGTARSPAIYAKITSLYPNTPVVVGDHFGSVTAGLTRWAQKCFAQ